MTLAQLNEAVRHAVSGTLSRPEQIEVVIPLATAGFGPRDSVGVSDALLGFDWEAYTFMLVPDKELWREPEAKWPREQVWDTGERIERVLLCPRCPNHVTHIDRYCSQCGQRLKGED